MKTKKLLALVLVLAFAMSIMPAAFAAASPEAEPAMTVEGDVKVAEKVEVVTAKEEEKVVEAIAAAVAQTPALAEVLGAEVKAEDIKPVRTFKVDYDKAAAAGTYKMAFKMPAKYNGQELVVIRTLADGTFEAFKAMVVDGVLQLDVQVDPTVNGADIFTIVDLAA